MFVSLLLLLLFFFFSSKLTFHLVAYIFGFARSHIKAMIVERGEGFGGESVEVIHD